MGLEYKSSIVPVKTEVAGDETSYSDLGFILLLAMHFLLIYSRVANIGNLVIGFTFFFTKKWFTVYCLPFRDKKRVPSRMEPAFFNNTLRLDFL